MFTAVGSETHSIKAAAVKIWPELPIRWARIKEAEQALGAKLVEAHVGGSGIPRSELTPLARDLLAKISSNCGPKCGTWWTMCSPAG